MPTTPPFRNWIGPGTVAEVVLRFQGPDNWPTMQFVIGGGTSISHPPKKTFTDSILANFKTELLACISTDYMLSGVVFNCWNSGTLTAHIEVPYADSGTVASPALPGGCCPCFVKRNTAVHLKPWPRTYFPCTPESFVQNSRWTGGALAALEAARQKVWHVWTFALNGWAHAIPQWNTGHFTALSTVSLVPRVCYLHRRRSRGSRSKVEFHYPEVW